MPKTLEELLKLIQDGIEPGELMKLVQASSMSMGERLSKAYEEMRSALRATGDQRLRYCDIISIFDQEKKVVVYCCNCESCQKGDYNCSYDYKYYEMGYSRSADGFSFTEAREVMRVTTYQPAQAILQSDEMRGYDFNVGQPLRQSINIKAKVLQDNRSTTGIMEIEGIATRADIINTKNQVYPHSVWKQNVDNHLLQMAQNYALLGEADHPEDRRTLAKSCLVFKEIWWQDKDLHFKADILPTEPDGKNLQIQVAAGVPVEISSFGYGTMKQGTWNGVKNVMIVQDDFVCTGFDAVLAGASSGSKVTSHKMLQSEEKENTDMELKELLEKLAQAQADGNQAEIDKLVQAIQAIVPGFKLTQATIEAAAPIIMQAAQAPAADAIPAWAASLQATVSQLAQNANTVPAEVKELLLQNARREAVAAAPEHLREKLADKLAQAKDVAEVQTLSQSYLDLAKEFGFSAPQVMPGVGMLRQEKQESQAPKTSTEAIERLVQASGLKDTGLDDPSNPARNLRILLQNSAQTPEGSKAMRMYLMVQSGRAQKLIQAGEMSSSDVVDGNPQLFPIITRAFPRLFAQEIASIQPLRQPDGKIFYLDHKRENGEAVDKYFSKDYSNRTAPPSGERTSVKKLNLTLTSDNVSATTKALGADWPVEMAQDLMAYHGIDAELEIVGAISDELAREWNYLMIDEMVAGATGGNVNFGKVAPTGWSQKDWDAYLVNYLFAASNLVFKKRYQDATFLLVGPDAALSLTKMGAKAGFIPSGETGEVAAGVNIYGTVNGTLKVYKCSYMGLVASDKMLLGRKGNSWSDTGYIWAPYATFVSDRVTDATTLKYTKSLMERAAHRTVIGDNFATLTIGTGTGVEL